MKLGIVDRFLLQMMLEEGKSTSEIANALGISSRMVQYLRKNPVPEEDREEKKIREFIERNPFLPPSKVASRLNVSLYKVYKVIKRLLDVPQQTEEDRRGLALAEELINRGEVARAARLITMITLMPQDHRILMKIPDELLPPSYVLSKFRYRLVNWGSNLGQLERELLDYLERLKEEGLLLYYYQGQILRLSILNMEAMFEEVLEFYRKHRKKIFRLPYGIRINLIAPIVEASVNLSHRGIYSHLLRYLEDRIKGDNFENGWHRSITRQVFFSALNHLGMFDRIHLLEESDNPVVRALYYLGAGLYEKVIRIEPSTDNRLYRFYLFLLKNMARLMLGWEEEPLSDFTDLMEFSPINRAYVSRYKILKYAREGNRDGAYREMEEVVSIMKEGIMRRVYTAILREDVSFLRSSPREVLLRYWLNRDVGRAVSYAGRFNMIFSLHEYAILKPPSSIRAYRYRVLRPVLPRPIGYWRDRWIEVGSRRIKLGRSAVDRAFLELLERGMLDRRSLPYNVLYGLRKKFFPLVEVSGEVVRLYGKVIQE